MKKKAELQFEPIVVAIIVLLLLAACIAVFLALTRGSFAGLFNLGRETDTHTQDSINIVSLMFGRCDTIGETVCYSETTYVCNNNNKWMKTDDTC